MFSSAKHIKHKCLLCLRQKEEAKSTDSMLKSCSCILFVEHSLISFKLYMMIDTSDLYILIPYLITLTIVQGHSCMRKQKLLCSFLTIFQIMLMKFSMLLQPFSFLKLMLNLFGTINQQSRRKLSYVIS